MLLFICQLAVQATAGIIIARNFPIGVGVSLRQPVGYKCATLLLVPCSNQALLQQV